MKKVYVCDAKLRTAVLHSEDSETTYVFHRWNGSVDIRTGNYEINIPDCDIEKVSSLLKTVAKLTWD